MLSLEIVKGSCTRNRNLGFRLPSRLNRLNRDTNYHLGLPSHHADLDARVNLNSFLNIFFFREDISTVSIRNNTREFVQSVKHN